MRLFHKIQREGGVEEWRKRLPSDLWVSFAPLPLPLSQFSAVAPIFAQPKTSKATKKNVTVVDLRANWSSLNLPSCPCVKYKLLSSGWKSPLPWFAVTSSPWSRQEANERIRWYGVVRSQRRKKGSFSPCGGKENNKNIRNVFLLQIKNLIDFACCTCSTQLNKNKSVPSSAKQQRETRKVRAICFVAL